MRRFKMIRPARADISDAQIIRQNEDDIRFRLSNRARCTDDCDGANCSQKLSHGYSCRRQQPLGSYDCGSPSRLHSQFMFGMLANMKLAELEREAVALSKDEKVSLMCTLLDTLPLTDCEVSDEEVLQREKDMESGTVKPISHEEFVAGVKRGRVR
jgi:hypothetical protein